MAAHVHKTHKLESQMTQLCTRCVFKADKQSSWQGCETDRGDVKWWGFCWQPALLEQVNQVQQIHTAGSTELLRTRHTKGMEGERDVKRQSNTRWHAYTQDKSLRCNQNDGQLITGLPTRKGRTGFIPGHKSRQTSEQTGGSGEKTH